ncbi:MAG: hypothetical protein NTY73_03035 [Candidatus Micrarchaeota archaeon]|nr:hypothetical protein [Candidatus Micrarchaeota archaeon]
MPRKKAPVAKKFVAPRVSDGVFYSLLIGLLITLITGAYFKSFPCLTSCIGQNIINGYPYGWFSYNTYKGWQTGAINFGGAFVDLIFWAFIVYIVMIVLHAAMKEMQ